MTNVVLTDAHRAQLPAWRDKWLQNALSTAPMDDTDRERTIWALHGLYDAAKLPRPSRIVFVASPFMIRFAGAFAAGLLHLRKTGREVTLPEPEGSGFCADIIRTTRAIMDGPPVSCMPPSSVDVEMKKPENKDWFRIDLKGVQEAARLLNPKDPNYLLSCAAVSYRMWQGGNQWSAWVGFLSFFRDVVGQTLPHEDVWQYWHAATIHSGPRIVHTDFVVVSDRPATLTIDEQQRPHNSDGPFAQWRDGTALYAWRGMRISRWIIENKDHITVGKIDAEQNAETRRAMIEIFTSERYIREGNCHKLHQDDTGILWHRIFPNDVSRDETWACVEVRNGTREPDGTFKSYFLQVLPTCRTAREAVAWTYNMSPEQYTRLVVRT